MLLVDEFFDKYSPDLVILAETNVVKGDNSRLICGADGYDCLYNKIDGDKLHA